MQKTKANKTIEIKDSVEKEVTQRKKTVLSDGKTLRDAIQDAVEQKKQEEIQTQKKSVSILKENPVGMLVVTQGIQSGKVLELRMGKNFVLQGINGEIYIDSRVEELICCYFALQYEIDKRVFFIDPMQRKEDVLLNGDVLLEKCIIQPYDKISIENVQFLFVPICGEHFNWNF